MFNTRWCLVHPVIARPQVKTLAKGNRRKKTILVKDIIRCVAGQTTDVFKRARPETRNKCLSLIHKDRTLDIEADSEAAMRQWLAAFKWLIENNAANANNAS